ncbi:ParA family protein [Pseudomonas asplenii]|uniref:ParA family protein n=1 Tax=Pseudomonas asplenii TaxID=53407 RepID=UPI0037C5EE60
MQVVALASTKGGVGKTTIAANLGGLAADAGLRVLMLDLDVQPTLSSYFALKNQAASGTYELLALNEQDLSGLISRTSVTNLDLIVSNDPQGQLSTLLLHVPDGRLRLRNLLSTFQPHYDLLLIDTQGARSILLEMAILASDQVLSPVTPEILAAREFRRGTLQLMHDLAPYRYLGIPPPPIRLLINRVHPVSSDSRVIQQALRQVFERSNEVQMLHTIIPAIEAYPRAATRRLPVHQVEYRKPSGRFAPAALETMRALASELFPAWQVHFTTVNGRAKGGIRYVE